jgi:hypothetical protein
MLYDTGKEKTSKSTNVFFFLIFIAIVVMFAVWVRPWEKPRINYYGFLDQCEQKMGETQTPYILCCADRNGYMKECSKYNIFNNGGFISVIADLQKLTPYDKYHACVFTTPLELNETRGPMIGEEEFFCTRLVDKRTPRRIYNSGFVNATGNINVMRLYMFPELGYTDVYDYARNLDKGTMVLNLTGRVTS